MLKKSIYIPVEWLSRELDSFILLTKFALKSKFRIFLGSKRTIHLYLEKKETKNGVFFYKGGLKKEICQFIDKNCDALVILDQEIGPVNNDDLNYKIKTRFYKGTLKFISRYYCIGQNVFEIGKKLLNPKLKGQSVLTGWPRVDIWKGNFNNLYKKEEKYIKEIYKNYILFSSSFICMDLSDIDLYKKRVKAYWTSYKHPVKKKIKQMKISYYEFLQFKNFLDEYDKNKGLPKLVIRPHPSENYKIWQDVLKDYSNIFLERKFDIHPWISNSKMVLHRGCTSAVHGQISNKKVVMIKLLKKFAHPHFEKFSDFLIKSPNEIKKILIRSKKKNKIQKKNKYLLIGKKFSSQNITDDINKINHVNSELVYNFDIKTKIIFNLKTIFYRYKNKFAFSLTNKDKLKGGIKEKEIKEKLENLNVKNFNIKTLIPNLIVIE